MASSIRYWTEHARRSWRWTLITIAVVLGYRLVALPSPAAEVNATTAAAPPKTFTEYYTGPISGLSLETELSIAICVEPSGRHSGTAYVPLWGETRWPLHELKYIGTVGHATIQCWRVRYSLKFQTDGRVLRGDYQASNGRAGRFVLAQGAPDTNRLPMRPQTPVEPSHNIREEVVIGAGPSRLSGEFMRSAHGGRHPVVILVPGAGTWDRDYESCGHRYNYVIADRLAAVGVATLRLDDRGRGTSTGLKDNYSLDQLADDVVAGVAYLRTREDVAPSQIGVIGHSLGGLVALIAASKEKDLSPVVLLACPVLNGTEVILKKDRAMCLLRHMDPHQIETRQRFFRGVLEAAASSETPEKAALQVQRGPRPFPLPFEGPEGDQLIERFVRPFCTKLSKDSARFEPLPLLRHITVPVLMIFGELDTTVSPSQTALAGAALAERQHTGTKVMLLPRHNHSLQLAESDSDEESKNLRETISEEALKHIAEWVTTQFTEPPRKPARLH